jgi:hypothetical protein
MQVTGELNVKLKGVTAECRTLWLSAKSRRFDGNGLWRNARIRITPNFRRLVWFIFYPTKKALWDFEVRPRGFACHPERCTFCYGSFRITIDAGNLIAKITGGPMVFWAKQTTTSGTLRSAERRVFLTYSILSSLQFRGAIGLTLGAKLHPRSRKRPRFHLRKKRFSIHAVKSGWYWNMKRPNTGVTRKVGISSNLRTFSATRRNRGLDGLITLLRIKLGGY